MPAALMVGSICVLRDKTSDPSVSYAADLNVRVSKLGEPTDDGKRIIEVAILDPDLKEVKHDGVPMFGRTRLGQDGITYDTSNAEEGYFLGTTDQWDISRLENLGLPEVVELDPARQLVSV